MDRATNKRSTAFDRQRVKEMLQGYRTAVKAFVIESETPPAFTCFGAMSDNTPKQDGGVIGGEDL